VNTTSTSEYQPTEFDIEAVLATHRAVFGNLRMEAEGEGAPEGEGDSGDASSDGEGEGSSDGDSGDTSGDGEAGDKPAPEDELPEWVKKELGKVRGEAASYRTKLRDAEKKLEGAKTLEEFEAATHELREANAQAERRAQVAEVARKFNLPDELASRLRGASVEELESDAKELQKFAHSDPEDLSGGLGGGSGDDSDPTDPAELARKYGRGRNKQPA
jgi:hypothetical protein